MKRTLAFAMALFVEVHINAAAAASPATPLEAQTLPGMAAKGGTSGDCAVAKDPLRCEARHKARETCKGLRSASRRHCLAEQQSPIDCSRSDNPRRCEAQQAASEACRNKSGKQHNQCMRDLLK